MHQTKLSVALEEFERAKFKAAFAVQQGDYDGEQKARALMAYYKERVLALQQEVPKQVESTLNEELPTLGENGQPQTPVVAEKLDTNVPEVGDAPQEAIGDTENEG